MEGQQSDNRQWSGRTDGLPWMLRALVAILRVVDRRVIYGVMALVVPFYMLFNHKGYLASYRFFRQRMEYGRLKSFRSVYLNHFVFGQVIIDRFAAYAGQTFSCEREGNERFVELSSGKEGFLQLSSHVGNYEMVGYTFTSTEKPINALVYAGESPTVMAFRKRILDEHNVRLIRVDASMNHLFEMNAAIDRGEIVSMTGDRIFGSSKSLTCDFLGERAAFPMGPFALAVQKNVPVLAIFAVKEKSDYRIIISEISLPKEAEVLKTREKMSLLAQLFANELEKTLKRYPTQWFNYYDFWNLPQ